MAETVNCKKVCMGKALADKKSSAETIHNGNAANIQSPSESKRRARFGKGSKGFSKSRISVRCCQPMTLSIDEFLEEENYTASKSMLPTGFCQNNTEESCGENMRLLLKKDGFLQDGKPDSNRSNCRCRHANIDCEALKIDKSCKRFLEQRPLRRLGSYAYNQYDMSIHELRSRSHSRLTYASSRNNTLSRSSSMGEWHIPFDDITLDEMIARSCKGPVYKGKWHGDVMVHKITKIRKEEFLKEIALLNLIRHENIVLFMGASTEGPDLAIITSPVKGYSLYTHIHEKVTMFAARSKLDIITQIAQGMEYLHAKKIELGKLCSRNVFLESKVKVGMTECIYKHIPTVKNSYGYIPDRQILSYGPEMLKSLRVEDGILCSEKPPSFASDVFAFGTILYEIFLEEYPYATEHLEIVIWNISSGRNLHKFDNMPTAVCQEYLVLKGLFEVCWRFEESRRPSFQEILESLRRQERPRLNRQYSISQPNVINLTHMNFPVDTSDDYY